MGQKCSRFRLDGRTSGKCKSKIVEGGAEGETSDGGEPDSPGQVTEEPWEKEKGIGKEGNREV